MGNEAKILPMPCVHGIWEDNWDPYPTIVRVSMTDGKVVNYYRDIGENGPVLKHSLDHFDRTCEIQKGGRRRARRRHQEESAAGVPGVAEDDQG